MKRQRFWDDLAQNDVHVRDRGEGESGRNTMRVNGGMRDTSEKRLDKAFDGGFADPAQRQTCESDTKLHSQEHLLKIAMKALYQSGADLVGLDELLDTRIADADQRKLGSHKEAIGGDQQDHQKELQGDMGEIGLGDLKECGSRREQQRGVHGP